MRKNEGILRQSLKKMDALCLILGLQTRQCIVCNKMMDVDESSVLQGTFYFFQANIVVMYLLSV